MSTLNPFFHRGPIHDQNYFYGRGYETAQVLSLVAKRQSVSLVGQRHIGKTSLLNHISNPRVFTQHGLKPDETLFVYIDGSTLSGLEPAPVYHVLLEDIRFALAHRASTLDWFSTTDSPSLTYRDFEQTLRRLTEHGQQLILLLDEFEQLSHQPQLDPDFFSGLRALAAKYLVSYVTASKLPLLELTFANLSVLSSPFFNIFGSLRLGLFSEAEARHMLIGLTTSAGTAFAPDTLQIVLDLAGYHPFFLQLAGYHAFELQQAHGDLMNRPNLAELRRRFDRSAAEHFAYYWHDLTASQQRVLATLHLAQQSQPDIVQELVQACLVVQRHGSYDYLSAAFQAFIESQPVTDLLKAGPIAIDLNRRQVLLHSCRLKLTTTQYNLLVHLVAHAGQVLTGEALERALWGNEYIEDPERLKAVIKGVRRALGQEAGRLENVRGVGYVWQD
jgi:hypothetical protein